MNINHILRVVHSSLREIGKRNGIGGRSGKWREIERNHLREEPSCCACGGVKNLQVHHEKPFHLHPELELVDTNLITLRLYQPASPSSA